MKKAPLIVVVACALVITSFFLGPEAEFGPVASPVVKPMNISLEDLDIYVHTKDIHRDRLKPNNESRIIWADSIRKTRYSLVYLHGFSASPMESGELPVEVAERYGMNLYIPLLSGHGQDDKNSFRNLKPNSLIEDAKEAVAIGQVLGEDVIVMSCSTGSTLSIYLAGANKELIDALIMYSPNIALYNKMAKLMTGPWGKQILFAMGGEYHLPDSEVTDAGIQYWTGTYHNDGLIALEKLLEQTMTKEVFAAVYQPYFIGYYYKNEELQDQTISVEAIKQFDSQTSTPRPEKSVMAFPEAGAHVITNPIKSQSAEEVRQSTYDFVESVLEIMPIINRN